MLGALKTIRRGERRETLTAFFVLFLVLMSHALLETARDALFLAKLPAAKLPLVYLGLAAVSLLVADLRARVAGAPTKRSLAVTLAACAAATALFWALLAGRGTWVLYALYLWPGLIAALVMLEFWTLLGDAFTITQAKRVYGAIGIGSVAGSIAGSALASWASVHFAPRHLLIPAALGLLAAGGASLRLSSPEADPVPVEPIEAAPQGMARAALHVLTHPYARGIVIVAVVSAITVTLADYLFKSAVAAKVGRAELGSFFARAYLAFNVLSLVCQGLFANLAVRKLGVPLAAAVLPAILLGTGALTLVLPLLPAAVLIRGADASLRHSLHRTAFELLSVPLHSHARGLVKRLVEIAGFRGGQAVAAIAILGIVTLPRPTTVLTLAVLAFSALWLVAALRTRAVYVELFRRRMTKGQVTHLKEFPQLDAASLETVTLALDSDDDREVIAAIEVLERDDKEHLVPKLLLFHPSHEVVRRALALFARSNRKSAVRAIDRLLAQATPGPLRAAALSVRASLDSSTVEQNPESELGEPEEVRAASAVCRTALFGADRAPVDALAHSPAAATRLAIAEAIAATECQPLGELLIELARDPEREVRSTAIAAMGRLGGAELVRGLVELMARDDTRGLARDQLVAMGDRALDALASALADVELGPVRRELGDVIARLEPEPAARVLVAQLGVETDGLVRYRLIRSLEGIVAHHPGVDFDRAVIRRAIIDTLGKAYRYLAYEIALEGGGAELGGGPTPGCRLLRRLLRDKRKHAVGRLFRLLGLAIPAESFAAAYRGIMSDRPELRANAIELIENVLPADLRAPVLGLIDDLSPVERLARGAQHHGAEPESHEQVLRRLLEGPAKTLREAAIYHAHELSHAD